MAGKFAGPIANERTLATDIGITLVFGRVLMEI